MANKRSPGLSPIVLRKKFGAGKTTRNYRDKEIVFSQGDTADAVFYIQSGTVKLTAVSTRRKKAIIAFLQRGRSSETRNLQRSLLHICLPGWFESRKTWSINSSISARGDGRGSAALGKLSRNQSRSTR